MERFFGGDQVSRSAVVDENASPVLLGRYGVFSQHLRKQLNGYTISGNSTPKAG